MLISKERMFVLLLTSLLWTINQGANTTLSTFSTSTLNSSTTSTLLFTVVSETTPSVILTSPENDNSSGIKNPVTETNTESNSIRAITSHNILLSQMTQHPNFTKKDEHYFSTNINTILPTSGMTTTSSDLPTTISKDSTYAMSSEMAPVNFTTASNDVNFTSITPPNKIQKTDITISTTWMTTKGTSVTMGSSAETSRHPNFTNSSEDAKEHQKDNRSRGAVAFGAIIGAALGTALVGLVGYLMCVKRKSDSFGHQRLYDDTRNDPVLRLDNTQEPFDTSLGHLSYYNSAVANESGAQNSRAPPHDTIPMDEMTSSRLAS